jgi:hypothetical protein
MPPVAAVMSENFIAYTYWNSRFYRREIAVAELYQDRTVQWSLYVFLSSVQCPSE